MKTRVSEAVTLFDKNSLVRRGLFRRLVLNSVDGIRFYEFIGNSSRLPVIGIFFKYYLILYYRHIHTKSVKLPLKDIEAIINNASQVSVGPCSCRLIYDDRCDNPLYTCMRINSFSKYTAEKEKQLNTLGNEKSRILTKNEAVEIARNARKHGMILQLESCVIPYQNNICMCCACCCVELKMRDILGKAMGPYGPYVPQVDAGECNGCGICVEKCPYHVVEMKDEKPSISADKCIQCGICAEVCPNGSLQMHLDRELIEVFPEPGIIKTMAIVTAVLFGHFLFVPFKLFTKSQQYKYHAAKPRKSDGI